MLAEPRLRMQLRAFRNAKAAQPMRCVITHSFDAEPMERLRTIRLAADAGDLGIRALRGCCASLIRALRHADRRNSAGDAGMGRSERSAATRNARLVA